MVVPKSGGSVTFCIDYRKLNMVSKFNTYPMLKVGDLLDKLACAIYLLLFNLIKGYWQIPLRAQEREKTAFSTQGAFSNSQKCHLGCTGQQ